jgi:CheY-like chemotaxis protein
MATRPNVMTVEDNRADLSTIKRSMWEAGVDCDVTSFTNGAEVIAFIDAPVSPVSQVIILDPNLPAVEGPSVLQRIRTSPRWSHVPVLVFFSSTAPADMNRVQRLGADAYIKEPSRLEDVAKLSDAIKLGLPFTRK